MMESVWSSFRTLVCLLTSAEIAVSVNDAILECRMLDVFVRFELEITPLICLVHYFIMCMMCVVSCVLSRVCWIMCEMTNKVTTMANEQGDDDDQTDVLIIAIIMKL